MVLVGEGGAEEGHDPIAHHLVHGALVAVDGVHHQRERMPRRHAAGRAGLGPEFQTTHRKRISSAWWPWILPNPNWEQPGGRKDDLAGRQLS